MPPCTFDSTTRLLKSKAQDQDRDTVGPHLAPALQCLAHGSRISEINPMAWSLIDLDSTRPGRGPGLVWLPAGPGLAASARAGRLMIAPAR